MVGQTGFDLLLFIGGAPGGPDDDRRGVAVRWEADDDVGTFRRLVGWLARPWRRLWVQPGPTAAEDATLPGAASQSAWHVPRELIPSVNLVLDAAQRAGRRVTVVDVNRREGQQQLIDRWIGPKTTLPLLVRGDGACLEGSEKFLPKKIRQFVGGP